MSSLDEILGQMVGRIGGLETRMGEAESKEWVGPTRGCRVYRNVTQSIPNGALTNIQYTTEIFDLVGCWDVAQPTRLVAPRDGYYNAFANIQFDNGGSVAGARWLFVVSSGGNILGGAGKESLNASAAYVMIQVHSNGPFYMTRGDWVTIQAYQNSGGAMNIFAATLQNQHHNTASLQRMH